MARTVDIFISHAGEDKDVIARPLAEALRDHAFRVWYDEYALKLGDRLRRSIDEGLNQCQYGIVILSHAFFLKEWPQRELDGMFAREVDEGRTLILPIWHGVSGGDVRRYSSTLADRVGIPSTKGIPAIVSAVRQLFESRAIERPVRQEIASVPALSFPPMVHRADPLSKCLASVIAMTTEVARTVMIRRLERLTLPEQSLIVDALSTSGMIADESGHLLPKLINSLQATTVVAGNRSAHPPSLFDYVFACGELDESWFARSVQADAVTAIAHAVRSDDRGARQLIMVLRDSCDVTAHVTLGWALDAASSLVSAEKGASRVHDRYLKVFWEEPLAHLRRFWEKAEVEV